MSRRRLLERAGALVALVVLAHSSAGCESFSLLPFRLERTRVLAIRVEVVGDPERSVPAPGERARLRALVVDPVGDRTEERGWRFRACVAQTDTRAGAACAEPPFADVEGAGEVDFELVAPGAAGGVLVTGIVCTGGRPILAFGDMIAGGMVPGGMAAGGSGLDCESLDERGDAEEVVISFAVSGEHPNRHPRLETEPVLGGEPLREGGGCADPRVARWPASRGEAVIAWDLGAGAREQLDERLEELLVSHLITHGELARYRSLVEPDEDPGAITVEYRPPGRAEVPEDGLDVSLVFVVRDERGGVAWLRRALCLTP